MVENARHTFSSFVDDRVLMACKKELVEVKSRVLSRSEVSRYIGGLVSVYRQTKLIKNRRLLDVSVRSTTCGNTI